MKKRAMTLGLALFCAFLLCGCQRTTPAASAQEAAPEPEAAEETVLLLEEPAPVEPEPEPEPEPFAAGEELLLFGIRTPTLTDGEALDVKADDFAACAQLSCVVTEDGVMLARNCSPFRAAISCSRAMPFCRTAQRMSRLALRQNASASCPAKRRTGRHILQNS